ncbi:MAG: energy transducer TonB [Cyclobacteriaceae bacterium]|nr:energy transducer TonB [Cyclobacteriaceae bacterium]
MEAKKSVHVDMYKKSGLFRSIGLMISLGITITAFQWKTYDTEKVQLEAKKTNSFELMVEIPPTEQPPPPAPQVQSSTVVEVPDEEVVKQEIKVILDMEVTDNTKVEAITIRTPEPEPEEESEKIFTIVEETAAPIGGMAAFYQYVSENIKYPAQAKRMGIQGRVYVEFVIAKDGTLTDVHIVKGIGAGCDEEAVRIVQGAPPWKPAKQRGKPVRQRYTLPIVFKMASL